VGVLILRTEAELVQALKPPAPGTTPNVLSRMAQALSLDAPWDLEIEKFVTGRMYERTPLIPPSFCGSVSKLFRPSLCFWFAGIISTV
jgi:hypothetical protein